MKDKKIKVSLRISKKLLEAVEKKYAGKSRSEKFEKAIEEGYNLLTIKKELRTL